MQSLFLYDNSLSIHSGAFACLQGPEDMSSPGENIDDITATQWPVEGPDDFLSLDTDDVE